MVGLKMMINRRVKKGNKMTLKKAKVLMVSMLVIMGLTACMKKGPVIYDDYNEFKAEFNGTEFELPDGAADLRMAIKDQGLAKTFLLSYVLDDEKMDEFGKNTVQDKYGVTQPDEDIDDEYFGILVKDIDGVNPNYTSDDFKHFLVFDAVIDDSVEDYMVLYYYPTLTGSTTKGILINPDTNRVLEFYYATIK